MKVDGRVDTPGAELVRSTGLMYVTVASCIRNTGECYGRSGRNGTQNRMDRYYSVTYCMATARSRGGVTGGDINRRGNPDHWHA